MMQQCPECGSADIHRSRSRSLYERLRKRWTSERVHRCHECNWRGWGAESIRHGEQPFDSPATPDFAAIDEALPTWPGSRPTERP